MIMCVCIYTVDVVDVVVDVIIVVQCKGGLDSGDKK